MPLFSPDSRLVDEVRPSPNFGERKGVKRPDMLILHYTGMKSADAALTRLTEKSSEVSSHYFIFEDGRIVQMVPEKKRAWHAGVSSWEGKTDINSRSIGIEIANPGHDFGYPEFPKPQIEAVIALCRDIVKRNRIRADRVLAHSDIAPGRKQDPGEKFPWAELRRKRVGHFVQPARTLRKRSLQLGDRGKEVLEAQKLFSNYGYGVPRNGIFDETTRDVVLAFQRHFRPRRVNGILDQATRITLEKLLSKRPR